MQQGSEKKAHLERILLVEDSQDVRTILRRILAAQGYEVDEAEDGTQALGRVNHELYDLIILDRTLPGCSGMEILQQLKKLPHLARIPVLFLSGEAGIDAQVEGLESGADDYVVKPFDAATLVARVRVHLRTKAQEDELRTQREAAEERNVLLTLQNAELVQLNNFKNGVLQRLAHPQHGMVAHIRECAQVFAEQETNLTPRLKDASRKLSNASRRIENLVRAEDFYGRAESALVGRPVLVVDSHRSARRFTSRAVFATGAAVESVSSAEEALTKLEQTQYDAVFVDWESSGVINILREKHPGTHMVLMTSEPLFEGNGREILRLPVDSVMVTNVLARAEAHDPMAVRELVTTAGKLLTRDIFGIEKYLGWGAALCEEHIMNSEQRHECIERVYDYAIRCGLRDRIARGIELLADELLMNAIWDAPVDAEGRPKYAQLARSEPLQLLPEEAVLVRYANDGNFLGVSVTDNFGRLQYDTAFKYLVKCFAKNEDQIHFGAGGAGLGLFMAYRSVSSFVINVDPGHKTEVIGLLNLHRLSPDELATSARSFCYFRAMASDERPELLE